MLGQGCARSSAVTGGGRQQPGRRGGAGRGRQARSYLLAPRAGVEAAGALCGVAAGDTLGCLEGAAGGGGRATVALPQTSASGHFLLPFPPWAHPPSLLISYFHSSPPAPGSPACAPNLRPQRTRERPVPAMSLLFWDCSVSSSLSLPGEARSPGAALSLPQLPAAQLRPLFGGREGGLERDVAPEESRVAKTWLREAAAPGVRESKSPRTQQVQLRRTSRLLERG